MDEDIAIRKNGKNKLLYNIGKDKKLFFLNKFLQ